MTQFLQRDSPIPRFFAYPKFLLTLDLSETAKMIYMLLLDRARLSMQKEGWQDEHGRIFIHYTIQSLATTTCKSEMTVKNALKALEHQGLIYRQRQGAGMPNRIFVKVQTENCPARGAENGLTGGTIFDRQTERKLSANKNKSKKMENVNKVKCDIQSHIIAAGYTQKEAVEACAAEYGWSDSDSNFSNKLEKQTLRYAEVLQLAEILGYDIIWRRRRDD